MGPAQHVASGDDVGARPPILGTTVFDWKNPDYQAIAKARILKLQWLREDPDRMGQAISWYREHTADFINDWGQTFDPRNIAKGLPARIPFILFPKQRDLIGWMIARWKASEPGICDKSREMGVSWITVSVIASMCIFNKGFIGGFGSRKLEYVDKSGDPKCLFWKARAFLDGLPPEFRNGWDRDSDAHCRISFGNGSAITGEAGDNIGRGDRTSIYVVDESAYVEHPEAVDAALSQTTLCRIDVSSAHGMGNSFARKRHTWPKERIFTFHWRDDPRKDDVWYQKQCTELDPIIIAQELDINYMASVEGILIPSVWVQAAVDAHKKLGIEVTGAKRGALDVADEGPDKNAFAGAHGILVNRVEDWSGEASNIFRTTQRAFRCCDEIGTADLTYDSDGMGVSVRGDAERINEDRKAAAQHTIEAAPFFAISGGVQYPDREDVAGKKNKDHFSNRKAQSWWALRGRFEKTYKWVIDGVPCDPDEIISLDSAMANLDRLTMEIAQVVYGYTVLGKLQIIKAPDGMASPNMADALMMLLGSEGTTTKTLIATEDMLLLGQQPVPPPTFCDVVFAVVCANLKGGDKDGAAVTYFAHTAAAGYPTIVLGWDIVEVSNALLDQWLPGVYTKLEAYQRVCNARAGSQGIWLKDDTTGAVLFNRAQRIGKMVWPIDSKLNDVDRALNVSGIVRDKEVQFSRDAMLSTKLYKGANKNHLVSQVNGFQPGMPDVESMVLLNSFTHGIALAKGNIEGY